MIDAQAYGPLLSFADIRYRIRFLRQGQLPAFRGATLRGAIGFSLKRTVCHVRNTPCQKCPVVMDCIYSSLFEGVAPGDRQIMRKYPNVPQPFVLILNQADPEEVCEGDPCEFTVRLYGPAISHIPYLTYAIMQAGEQGLGKQRIPFVVEQVTQDFSSGQEKLLYDGSNSNIQPGQADSLQPNGFDFSHENHELQIRFETPVRYLYGGKICFEPEFMSFLKAAVRRVRLMTYFYGRDLNEQCAERDLLKSGEGITMTQSKIDTVGFSRYSNRQKRRMSLGGMLGKATYRGDFRPLYGLLKLSELTHVGKATSFGFGRIKIEPVQ